MTLSDLAIRRPVFAWMLMFGLIVFGGISWWNMGVSYMPDVDFPVLTISASYPGAAPEVVEATIVDKIEQAVISVEGIKDISSSIKQGSATITLEFDINRNVDVALQEVQANVSRLKFPEDVDPPTITKTNPEDQPILWIGVKSSRSIHDVIVYADLFLRDQFQIVPGVGEVVFGGFTDRNLRVWVDDAKLKKYELSILDVQKAIEREHIEISAGVIENDKKEFNVRTMGEGLTAADVSKILITQRGSQAIYDVDIHIGDVAWVEDGLDDVRSLARISGTRGIGMGFKKQRGTNAVEVAQRLINKMNEINKTLPPDIQMQVNFDSTVFIKESVEETEFTLVLSCLVTALVCWLFLNSWSSTFNVLLSIPTSVIGTFIIMYFMGFTLNIFTLLALSLAVGIVVDDAIMVLENIVRHAEMGKNRVAAARDGAREITFAAIAASVAVIAIFLPIAFMQGIIGKFLFQFGITLSGAVALSLLEAITITPMRCAAFLDAGDRKGRFAKWSDQQFDRLSAFYSGVLAHALNFRGLVLLGSLALFIFSIFLGGFIRKELIPPQDQSVFLVRFRLPIGSSLPYTSSGMAKAEEIIKARPDVLRYFAAAGFGGGSVDSGLIFITLKPRSERAKGQYEIMAELREDIKKAVPEMTPILQDLSLRGFTAKRGQPIEFNIRGPEWKVLEEKAKAIQDKLQATGLVEDLDSDYRVGMPEVRVYPDREAAALRGVSMEDIGKTINAAIGGVRQNEFSNDGRRYYVRLRLIPEERVKPEDIDRLQVRNLYGELVNLKDITRIEVLSTVQTITRLNRERSITITSNIAKGKSQGQVLDAVEKISREVLPSGYHFYFSGASQTYKESNAGFLLVLGMGVLVAYMVLASQFNSFVHPLTVLLSLPFSISGAFFGLLITHQSLNLYSFIGLILLMGIVKKNGILLVEFTNKKRYEDKLPVREALLTAAQVRLRPILMTSAATIAAAIPPALALGPGAESRIPMAVTILGGVLVSTIFTLVVVPCFYSLMAGRERAHEYEDTIAREFADTHGGSAP